MLFVPSLSIQQLNYHFIEILKTKLHFTRRVNVYIELITGMNDFTNLCGH